MKISIYKVDCSLFKSNQNIEFESLEIFFGSRHYTKEFSLSEETYKGFEVSVWIESDNRYKVKWQNEIEQLQNSNLVVENSEQSKKSELFSNLGEKHNCVITISSKEKEENLIIFAIPFGHAFNDIEDICDPNFGLEIASKVLNYQTLNTTNVNIYFKSTLRQLTNYKRNTFVQSKSSESYDALNGTPIDKYIELLGKTISCSKCVSINKYNITDYLEKLLPFFENYESLEDSITFPKVQKILKSSEKNTIINNQFVTSIRKGEKPLVSIIGYSIVPDGISLIESEIQNIFIKGKKQDTLHEMDVNTPNIDTIIEYIKNDQNQSELSDYKVTIAGEEPFIKDLVSIIQTEIDFEKTQYVLSDGYWCYFNNSYLDKLDDYLQNIEINLNTNLLLYEGQLKVKTNNCKITEDDYIDQFRNSDTHTVLHKKMVKPLKDGTPFGNGIELCDVVIESGKKTLVAIKKGFSTVDNAYSIDQSLLSLLLIANPKDFDLGGLESYLSSESIAIQWILPLKSEIEPYGDKLHTNKVKNGTFQLTDLKSILLKNKLMEWHSRVKELNKNPIVYLDTPLEI